MKISFSKQTKERAFKQLYEEYYAPFCLYAKRFVDDKETREDIVSDVFTSLWDKLDTDSFDLQSCIRAVLDPATLVPEHICKCRSKK